MIKLITAALLVVLLAATAAAQDNLARLRGMVERGELEAAEAQLWEAVTANPADARALALLGTLRLKQKRNSEAEALFQRALALDPRILEAHRGLGEIYAVTNKLDLAIASYEQARALAPRDARVALALASVLSQKGEHRRSLEVLNSVPARQRPPGALAIRIAGYLGLKQTQQVAALMPQVIRQASVDPRLVPSVVNSLLDHGLAGDAAELLKATEKRQKITTEYLLVTARVQETLELRQLAERTLARAMQSDPKSYDAVYQAARLAFQAQQWKRVEELLQRAITLDAERSEAYRQLAVVRMRMGETDGAIVAARRFEALQPSDPEALYLLATAYADKTDWANARKVLDRLLPLRDDVHTRVLMGLVLLRQGDTAGATTHIDRALQVKPDDPEARYHKGLIARHMGQIDSAIEQLEFVAKTAPEHGGAQAALGTLYLQVGNFEGAKRALERAAEIRPDIAETFYHLSLAYARLGMREQARKSMEQFEKLRAKMAEAP